MSEKKYKLSDDTKKWCGHKLYRIIALRDFSLITGEEVKKGDKGGWIESEYNLSQTGRAWVKDEAIVCEKAQVSDNGLICNNALATGHARIKGNATVLDRALIREHGVIRGCATAKDNAVIKGNSLVKDNVVVSERGTIDGVAIIANNSMVYGYGYVGEKAIVRGNSKIFGKSVVKGMSIIDSNAEIGGLSQILEKGRIGGNARIYGKSIIKYPHLITKDIREDLIQYIAASLNVYPIKGKYYLYKRVNKVKEGVYKSIWDSDFIYKLGEYAEAKKVKEDFLISCDSGLHVSTADYWHEGDTLIAVEVDIKDIITCMEGKLRVRKLKVIDEIWSKK